MAPSRATIRQTTLRSPITFDGIGLHTGERIDVCITPAPADAGLVFVADGVRIPARAENVVSTIMATTLGRDSGRVSTVEHLLAALAGMEIDNAVIDVRGSEVPILDGSSRPFVQMIQEAGVREL